ncbi:glucose/galactose MFS transporter [Thalassotalea insulae]|uniref:Glucose/galactose MFS transporter n=1 Tax=Thalassotalea insulae TaxID=2056778 RepID=A0ABQ6GPD2_9GAMM|nr:sugar MFS transporter [Thalassotalea insulae]GLX77838.1 glucose/galactose MFS transporter [Thalassotalea insulae]
MASTSAPLQFEEQASTSEGNNYNFALTALTSLFFIWGFITCLNDILIPHLKAVFDLSYSQAMLVQFCFFGAYFLVSLPAGKIVKQLGFQKGIVLGLVVAAIGCFGFYPAAAQASYPIFLLALFVLASGITILQVSANPYVSILGKPKTASSRLTLTQAFNSLGTTVAPFFGAYLILENVIDTMSATEQAQAVQLPYVLLGVTLLVIAIVFYFIRLPQVTAATNAAQEKEQVLEGSAWQYRHLLLGAVGIFLYVGAEVSIGSFLVSFFAEPSIAGLAESEAAKYITYYWGGAMVGRFIGAAVMQKLAGGKVLAFNAGAAIVLISIAAFTSGQIAMSAILLVGLCNSIMFPTIFSLAINGLGKYTSQGSGILCLAIVGGAIVPLLQGLLADVIGLQLSFLLPMLSYGFIAYFGLFGSKPSVKAA